MGPLILLDLLLTLRSKNCNWPIVATESWAKWPTFAHSRKSCVAAIEQ
jgi:hypothetical protein